MLNGKVYVGQTTMSIERRWITHKSDAVRRAATIFSKAIKKYTPSAFVVVELGRAFSAEELNGAERRAIWSHSSDDREYGYNIEPGGSQGPVSATTRKKMSVVRIGMKFSDEHRANIRAGKTGKKWSAERRANHRPWKLSPETIAKRAELRGVKRSAETRAKMSAVKLNQSPETRAKIAAAHRGKTRSEETRIRVSQGLKAYFARRKERTVELIERDQWASAT